MKQKMKKAIGILLVLAMSFSIAACGSKSSEERDTLTYIAYFPSDSLVPLDIALCEPNILHAIYDGFVKMGSDGEMEPMLAESWEDDSEKTVFHLNKEAKFHDGTPVTADDVIFSLDLYYNDGPYSFGFQENIAKYEKNDDYTVTLYKAVPYTNLLAFSIENIYILPQKAYEADEEGFASDPIGSGPYRFVSQGSDGTVTLEAFEDYHLGAPEVKNIVVKPPVDSSTGVVAMETGEADLMMDVPISQLAVVEGNDDLTLVTNESSWSCNTLLAMGDTFKNDPNLRKAVFHAVNRENGVKLANGGIGSASTELFFTRIMGDYAGMDYGPFYDEALAKEYLEKSDYDGKEFTIVIWQDSDLAESIQSDLMKIGIKCGIEQVDSNAWYDMLFNGELELTIAPLGSMTGTVESLLISMSSDGKTYGVNMAHSEEYDAVVNKMKNEKDDKARAELVKEALKLLYDRADVISIYDTPFSYVINSDFDYVNKAGAAALCLYFGDIKLSK